MRVIECRPCAFFSCPYIGIKDIFNIGFLYGGKFSSCINIIGCKLRIDFCLSVHAVGKDNRKVVSTNISDGIRFPAGRREVVEFRCFYSGDIGVILAGKDVIY